MTKECNNIIPKSANTMFILHLAKKLDIDVKKYDKISGVRNAITTKIHFLQKRAK